jgi:beta-N-acetylglucosaminidase
MNTKRSRRFTAISVAGRIFLVFTLSLALSFNVTAIAAFAQPLPTDATAPVAGATEGTEAQEDSASQPDATAPDPATEAPETPIDEGATQDESQDSADEEPADSSETDSPESEGVEVLSDSEFELLAAAISEGLYTFSSALAADKVIDIVGGNAANGARVQLWQNNTTSAQRFRITANSDKTFTITNVNSGKVLDVRNAEANNGAVVWQYTPNGTDAQKWVLTPATDGSSIYKISSKLNGKYCLDARGALSANGTVIQLYESNNTKAQRFKLNKIERTLADGTYVIGSVPSGRVLDVVGGSNANQANVQLYDSNNTYAQRFQIAYDTKTGYYTIINVQAARALDVAGAATNNGANVQMFSRNNTSAQKWTITLASSGKYSLAAANCGLMLDAKGGGTANGTNVQIYSSNKTTAQQWTFKEALVVNEGVFLVKSALGTVLDVDGNNQANGTRILTYTSNGTTAQKFLLKHVSKGYYRLECLNSGRVLDVKGAVGPTVQLYDSNNSDAQLFMPVPAGAGMFYLVNKATNKALDIEGANAKAGAKVQVFTQNQTNAQKWSFAATVPLPDGLFTIVSALNKNKVLDIRGGSIADGAKLQLFDTNGTSAQRFKLSRISGSNYRIVCLGSNKALDVKDTSINATTGVGIVQQWTIWGDTNKAQIWRIEYQSGGNFRVFSTVGNGTSCLDVTGGSTANSTDVNVSKATGKSNQSFKFVPAGSASTRQLDITLDQMVQWQRDGNSYIDDISTADLRSALDPAQNNSGSWYYQFADLRTYSGLSAAQINTIIASTVSGRSGKLKDLGSAFVAAAHASGLNECYLLAHAILESGWGTSTLAKGYYYDGKTAIGPNGRTYPAGTYYNFYGIGAVDSSPLSGGRSLAIQNGWNTPEKAVTGAAQWLADNYIYRAGYAQPTLYDMKWDVMRSNDIWAYGWHQYATDHAWAQKIAALMGSAYSTVGYAPALLYIVPRYR